VLRHQHLLTHQSRRVRLGLPQIPWARRVWLEMIKPLALPQSSIIHGELMPLSPGQEWETECALAAESTEAIPNPIANATRGRSGQFRIHYLSPGLTASTASRISKEMFRETFAVDNQPTGRRVSQMREIQMRRNYSHEARKGWDLNMCSK
jgi:hypothetical protein